MHFRFLLFFSVCHFLHFCNNNKNSKNREKKNIQVFAKILHFQYTHTHTHKLMQKENKRSTTSAATARATATATEAVHVRGTLLLNGWLLTIINSETFIKTEWETDRMRVGKRRKNRERHKKKVKKANRRSRKKNNILMCDNSKTSQAEGWILQNKWKKEKIVFHYYWQAFTAHKYSTKNCFFFFYWTGFKIS